MSSPFSLARLSTTRTASSSSAATSVSRGLSLRRARKLQKLSDDAVDALHLGTDDVHERAEVLCVLLRHELPPQTLRDDADGIEGIPHLVSHARRQLPHRRQPVPPAGLLLQPFPFRQVVDHGHAPVDPALVVPQEGGADGQDEAMPLPGLVVALEIRHRLAPRNRLLQGRDGLSDEIGPPPPHGLRRGNLEDSLRGPVEGRDAAFLVHGHHGVGHAGQDVSGGGLQTDVGAAQEGVTLPDGDQPDEHGRSPGQEPDHSRNLTHHPALRLPHGIHRQTDAEEARSALRDEERLHDLKRLPPPERRDASGGRVPLERGLQEGIACDAVHRLDALGGDHNPLLVLQDDVVDAGVLAHVLDQPAHADGPPEVQHVFGVHAQHDGPPPGTADSHREPAVSLLAFAQKSDDGLVLVAQKVEHLLGGAGWKALVALARVAR